MAAGDVVVFNEALAYMLDGGWEAADDVRIALVTVATAPMQGDTTPILADYTEVAAGGAYTAVTASTGELLATWGACVTQSSNVMTFDDTGASVVWLQNGSSPTDARYGVIVNADSPSLQAICFVDLGAVIDMTAGDLTITWGGSGIFTITN